MPTYHALGVTASLTVTGLHPTVTQVLDQRQGKQPQLDTQRINNVFEHGQRLAESPIGASDTGRGVMQFIGDNDDLPFFMVQAGEGLERHWANDSLATSPRPSAQPLPNCPSLEAEAESDSSLSSLMSLREVPDHEQVAVDSARPSTHSSLVDQDSTKVTSILEIDGLSTQAFDRVHEHLQSRCSPKALRVKVSWTGKTFLSTLQESRTTKNANDLKLEVFVNGILAGVTFVSRRFSPPEVVDKSAQLTGMRIHRQMEKPFVYDTSKATKFQPRHHWSAISDALQREAHERGTNMNGETSPSAKFLAALSTLRLPDQLATKGTSFGTVDIIITAGNGNKYGPETRYLIAPTRMDNDEYQSSITGLQRDGLMSSKVNLRTHCGKKMFIHLPSSRLPTSSSNTPLLDQELHADCPPSTLSATQVHDEQQPRSIGFDAGKQLSIYNHTGNDGPRVAFTRSNTPRPDTDTEPGTTAIALKLRDTRTPPPKSAFSPENTDRDSQKCVDLALKAGAEPRGYLVSHIVSTSPPRPSPRRTRSKAQTETTTPQSQGRKRKSGPKPDPDRQRKRQNTSEPASFSIRKTGTTRGTRLKPNDVTPEQALRDFRIPDTFVGSVLGLAEGDLFRQIGKERKGEFKEESVVVGMRFIVL